MAKRKGNFKKPYTSKEKDGKGYGNTFASRNGNEGASRGSSSVGNRVGSSLNDRRPTKDLDNCRTNDINWWNKAKELFTDATRTPHEYIRGSQYPAQFDRSSVNFMGNDRMLPGVMRINYVNGPGWAKDPTDPINRMFTNMMSDMLAKTASNTLNFQQVDLVSTFLMGTDIAANIAALKRVLSFSYDYPIYNRLLPKVLIHAMGFDPNSILGKQDNCRVILNDLIRDYNSLSIPNFIDLVDREYSLNHNVWAVDNAITSPLYFFRKVGYYTFISAGDEATTETCQFKQFDYYSEDTVYTFEDMVSLVRAQLDSIRYTSFISLVTAGLRRAYKDSQRFMFIEPVGVDVMQTPSVSQEILMQIANASIIPINTSALNITGDVPTGVVNWTPMMHTLTQYGTSSSDDSPKIAETTIRYKPLKLYNYEVTPESIMEATRLMNFVDDVHMPGSVGYSYLSNCGPDIVVGVDVIRLEDPETMEYNVISLVSNYPDSVIAGLKEVAFSNFTIYPIINNISVRDDEDSHSKYVSLSHGTLGNCHRFAPIDRVQFKLLQDAALTSLYMYEQKVDL